MTVACGKVGLQQAGGSGNLRGVGKIQKSRQDAGATRERRLRFLYFDALQASTCGAGVIFVCRLPADLRDEDSKENASEGGTRAFANALRVTWAQAGMPVLLRSRGLTIGWICSIFCMY